MSALTISDTGITLLQRFEGYRDTAYQDIAGVWTIGYGTIRVNGERVTSGMTCTVEQATEWMHADLRDTEATVNAIAPDTITQYQFDACVIFAYNIGSAGFRGSTVGKKVQAGQFTTVLESNFTSWNKVTVNGVLVPSIGLTTRRKAEYYLFSTGKLPS